MRGWTMEEDATLTPEERQEQEKQEEREREEEGQTRLIFDQDSMTVDMGSRKATYMHQQPKTTSSKIKTTHGGGNTRSQNGGMEDSNKRLPQGAFLFSIFKAPGLSNKLPKAETSRAGT